MIKKTQNRDFYLRFAFFYFFYITTGYKHSKRKNVYALIIYFIKKPKQMKTLHKICFIIAAALIFQSCSFYKAPQLIKKGVVKNTDYVQEMAFNYSNDLIFVAVIINEKKYNFVFDTGAETSVIGKHIVDEIEYKSVTSVKVNAAERLEFIEIPKITIASVDFENTGAIIADITHFDKTFGCKSIDGIVGNNLMRKAAWQIDYKNQKITIADNIKKLNVAENASAITMNAGKIRNIYFDVTIDGVPAKFTFDTGYNGKIKADSSFFNSLAAKNEDLTYATDSGVIAYTIFGAKMGKTYHTMAKSVDIEGLILTNQIIALGGDNHYLIGNEVFKNYTLTIDWESDQLYFEPTTEIKADQLKGYELSFTPNFITKKFEIVRFRVEHALEEKISVDAEILKINGVDVTNFSLEEFCAYWEKESKNIQNYETLDIVVLDDGVMKKIRLTNKVLLGE